MSSNKDSKGNTEIEAEAKARESSKHTTQTSHDEASSNSEPQRSASTRLRLAPGAAPPVSSSSLSPANSKSSKKDRKSSKLRLASPVDANAEISSRSKSAKSTSPTPSRKMSSNRSSKLRLASPTDISATSTPAAAEDVVAASPPFESPSRSISKHAKKSGRKLANDDDSNHHQQSQPESLEPLELPGVERVGTDDPNDDYDPTDRTNDEPPSPTATEEMLVYAEVAPDVETLVQERISEHQRLQQEEQQRQQATNSPNNNNYNIQVATTVVVKEQNKRNYKMLLIGIFVFVVVIVATVVGLTTTRSSSVTTLNNNTPIPTSPPSMVPTLAPTFVSRTSRIQAALANLTSTDSQALEWLLNEDDWEDDQGLPEMWLERYSLAVLYFKCNGEEWLQQDNWMTSQSVCDWWGVTCNDEDRQSDAVQQFCNDENRLTALQWIWGAACDYDHRQHVVQLTLDNNTLSGALPPEIGTFQSLTLLDLDFNNLFTRLPTELGQLTMLQSFKIRQNDVIGTIPSEMGNMTSLEYLWLNYNGLTRKLPTELGKLTLLKDFRIGYTQITGTIPTEMAALTRMEFFAARNVSGLVGCIPFGPLSGDIDGSGLTNYCFV